LSQREIADALDTDTTTVTVICDSLERKEYIRRAVNPADRRSNLIFATERGSQAFKLANLKIDAEKDRLLAAIDASKMEEAIPLFEKIYRFFTDDEAHLDAGGT
jgi:DNA-binding MarR family transcriptional regulator